MLPEGEKGGRRDEERNPAKFYFLTFSFSLQAAVFDEVVQHRTLGVSENAADWLRLLLQKLAHSRKSAARAGAENHGVNSPRRLRPDLGPSCLKMRPAVGRVVELIRPNRVVEGGGKAGGLRGKACRVQEGKFSQSINLTPI